MKLYKTIILLFFIPLLYLPNGKLLAGDQKLDSLLKILTAKNLDKETKLNTLVAIFYRYDKLKMKSCLKYSSTATDLSKSTNIPLSKQFHLDVANASYQYGNTESALKSASKLIKFFNSGNDTIYYLKAKQLQANLILQEGLLKKSINLHNKLIEDAKELEEYEFAAGTSYQLANIFLKIGDKENVYQYLLNAYKLFNKVPGIESDKLIEILYQIGENSQAKKDYQSAISFYLKARDLSFKTKDSLWVLKNTIRIGWNYYLMGELEKSHDIYKKAIPMSKHFNEMAILANAYGNLGTISRDKKDYKGAQSYYDKAINIAKENKDTYNLSWIYNDMSIMYALKENYHDAYNSLHKHLKYFKIESSKISLKKLGQEKMAFDAEKKEKELELLTIKLQKNQNLMFGVAGGTLLLLIIAGLFFQQSRVKNLRRMEDMNHKISEITQKNLRQQMNPHFIFNTLNSIQYYMFQNDKISTNDYMTKFSSLMRKTLENSTHTAIPIQDEIDALRLYLDLESLRFKEKFKWEIKIDEEIDCLLYKIPTMLIQPYVENSICHGLINKDDQGHLFVELKLMKDSIDCTIEDNGIGREAALEIKNRKKGNHNSLGTTITESRLKLVNALYGKDMKIHYEDLKDENGLPVGTKVIINIPIIS